MDGLHAAPNFSRACFCQEAEKKGNGISMQNDNFGTFSITSKVSGNEESSEQVVFMQEEVPGISRRKADLRASLIARRQQLDVAVRSFYSLQIAERVMELSEVQAATVLHLYMAIPKLAEVDTAPLALKLHDAGKMLLVPVVAGDQLVSVAYRPGDPVGSGALGQPEPVMHRNAGTEAIDVVLLPVVGCDRSGYRLGYGKGYYDRFLHSLEQQHQSPCRIGLAFSLQYGTGFPVDSWDEALDFLVTETATHRFGCVKKQS